MVIQGLATFPTKLMCGKWCLTQAAGGLLGLGILAWAAVHSGPTNGEVVVHVTEPDVDVSIGGHTYHVEERRFAPIVCELPPGLHELVVKRNGLVLDRQSFAVERGSSQVLTAWDPDHDRSQESSRPLPRTGLIP
jgi:hypothetical protein